MRLLPYFEVYEGFVPDEQVEYFFRRSAITVMPYKDATQSGVAMIAMPFGSTVAVTDVGDISEVVENGKTGILCAVDIQEIAMALIDLLGNPEKTKRLGCAGRDFAISNCSWANSVKKTMPIYESIIYKK